jgi:triacylglycerol esterase/lipase EstA (alpha/beta hydrolase family)
MSSSFLGRGSGAAAAVLVAAVLALAAAPSAFAASAVFGGTTNADEPIVLVADQKNKKLKSAVIALEAECRNVTDVRIGWATSS